MFFDLSQSSLSQYSLYTTTMVNKLSWNYFPMDLGSDLCLTQLACDRWLTGAPQQASIPHQQVPFHVLVSHVCQVTVKTLPPVRQKLEHQLRWTLFDTSWCFDMTVWVLYYNCPRSKLELLVYLILIWFLSFTEALKAVLAKCVAGASVRDLCKAGDACLEEELAKVYRKDKNMKKGKSFFSPSVYNDQNMSWIYAH